MPDARQYHQQMVHYLRKSIVFGDDDVELTVGTIPAGAVILPAASGVIVTTVFNAGTANVLDIGTTADPDLYATDLALGTLGQVTLDEAVDFSVSADTTITATPALTGTAATTGAGIVIIAYAVNNDG